MEVGPVWVCARAGASKSAATVAITGKYRQANARAREGASLNAWYTTQLPVHIRPPIP